MHCSPETNCGSPQCMANAFVISEILEMKVSFTRQLFSLGDNVCRSLLVVRVLRMV